MNEVFTFTPEEKEQTLLILERLRNAIGETFTQEDETHLVRISTMLSKITRYAVTCLD